MHENLQSLLKNRSYVFLQIAKFLFMSGYQMQSMAIGWHIYDLTKRPLALGLAGLAFFIPVAFFSMLGGDLVDRKNRKHLIIIAMLFFSVASGALYFVTRMGWATEHILYVLIGLLGVGRGIYSPSMHAILPRLVTRQSLTRAVSLSSSVWQLATVLGPVFGGQLYAATHSPALVYALAWGCSVVAALCISFIDYHHDVVKVTETMWQRAKVGVRFIFSHKIILGAISLDLFAVLLGGAVALMPVYADQVLHVGATGLGILRAAPSIGSIIMAWALTFRPIERSLGKKMFAAFAVFGLMTIVFGLSTNMYLSLAALVILGAVDMISVVVRGTLIQKLTPDHMRGRVAAVNQIFIGASNELGEFESGVTAHWFGVVPAVVIGGIGTIIVAGIWSAKFKELRDLNRLD